MNDLPVLHTMSGTVEPITDFDEFKYKESTEGEKSLSFYVYKTERNEVIFDLIVNKENIEFDGNKYVIDTCDREPIGTTVEKHIEARHEMFDRLKGEFIEEQYTGALRIGRCLDIALAGSGLTYEIIGNFKSRNFENFGRERGLDLFKKIIDRFGVEYRVQGTHLIIATEIANVTDAQSRHGHNLKSISESVDTTDLATFIKGFSYDDETDELLAYAEYESPNSHLYRDESGNKRLIRAEYVYDNRFRHDDQLLEEIKSRLKDVPDYNLQITYEELKKNGFNLHYFQLGDYAWAIYEPLNLDIQVRIISIESYPYDPHLSPVLELGSFRHDVTKTVAGLQGTAKRVDAQEESISQARSTASRAQVAADEAQRTVSTSSETLNQHLNDYTRHITDAERQKWNSSVSPGDASEIVRQHEERTDNPHTVTKQQIGLGSVRDVRQASEQAFSKHIDDSIAHWLQEEREALEQTLKEIKDRLSKLEGGG